MSSHPLRDTLESFTEDISVSKILNDMSPVTNLALNMKSLTTSLTGTPSRRISWSNPFPSDIGSRKVLEDLSPSTDSPTFQEISCRRKNKLMSRKASRKVSSSESEDEKENVAPIDFISPDLYKEMSGDDTILKSISHDSGYCDMPLKRFEVSSLDSTPRVKGRSSMYVDDDEDGFESLFQMDEGEDDKDLINIPDMTSLLTKPLYSNSKFQHPQDILTKKGKLPIRRCLSMEMECIPISAPIKFELISETGTLLAIQSDKDTEHETPKRCPFKRPEPPSFCFSIQNKRRKSSPSVHLSENSPNERDFTFQRSYSETAATIMHAVQQADLEPDLIGDCTRSYALPLIKGRHQDLKCISGETLVHLLQGEYTNEIDSFTLVDCRYPYEFEGGHIKGAVNIYTKEMILQTFLEDSSTSSSARNIIIFHCEFSSERAPSLSRFLRNRDREMNESNYPKLRHPEIYLLNGGFKAFFGDFKEFCEPQSYKPMNHKDHGFELKHFRAKSKSWGADSKSRYKLKTSSMSEVL